MFKFELEFIDAEFSGVLAKIPVKVVPTSIVSPSIDLALAKGETSVQVVSCTFFPTCMTPFEINVQADNKGALVNNLSGSQKNGCGGQKSQFKIEIAGTGFPKKLSLQFIKVNGGGVLESIPVKIVPPESLMGVWIATTMMTMTATTMVTSIATMAMMTVTLATTMLLQKEPIAHYNFFEFSSFILLDMTINRRDNQT